MTVPVVLAIAGVVSLLVGVLGGGIKAREVEIPSMPTFARVISSLGGLILIGVSIWLSSPEALPVPTPTPSVEPTSTATGTSEPSPTLQEMTATVTEGILATDTPEPPTPLPSPVPFAGPFSDDIIHNPENESPEGSFFQVDLSNFILEGTVVNPYPVHEHPWSFAIGFRYTEPLRYFLQISSDGTWYYGYRDENDEWNYTARGKVNNLKLNEGEENHIKLFAYESDGCLYINDQRVADLDLSKLDQPGDIFLTIGPYEVANEVTHYENFLVYRTSSLDCP